MIETSQSAAVYGFIKHAIYRFTRYLKPPIAVKRLVVQFKRVLIFEIIQGSSFLTS
jgi:hypothetical protein